MTVTWDRRGTTTTASGAYTFTGLVAGSYSVDYTVPTGYANTGVKPQSVTVTAGQLSTGTNFFAQQRAGSLSGTVRNDDNGNGVAGSGESSVIGGVVVYVDANSNGSPDPGEASSTTDGAAPTASPASQPATTASAT